jgi:hypothetical protein
MVIPGSIIMKLSKPEDVKKYIFGSREDNLWKTKYTDGIFYYRKVFITKEGKYKFKDSEWYIWLRGEDISIVETYILRKLSEKPVSSVIRKIRVMEERFNKRVANVL